MGVAESIGGFFVSLGLVTDKQSFKDGINGINSVENSLKKIVGASAAAAAALTGIAAAASQLEMESLKTAHAIGVSATSLDKWKVAAGVAGVNAKGLTAEMLNLERKMQRLKLGDVDTSLAKSLGMLRINYSQFAGMNAEERMITAFGSASQMKDQQKAAILIGDTLGSAAQEYYQYLQLTGKTLDEELQKSQRLVFTDDETKRDSLEFMYELKGLITAVKNIGNLLGAEVGKQLTPIIKNFKEIIARNKELIKTGIVGFVEAVGSAFNAVVGVIERVSPVVGALVDKMGGLDHVIETIGIGIVAIKAANVVGGIAKIVSSIGLLKSAIAGLGLGALYILIDDIVTYFTGKGNSVTGVVVDAVKELREQLEINPDMDIWEGIADAIEKIMTSLGLDFDAQALKDVFEMKPDLNTWDKISYIISEIGKTFGLDIDPDILRKIGDNIRSLGETITGGDNIPTFLNRVANGLVNLGLVAIEHITAGAASLAGGISGLISSVTNGQDFISWLTDLAGRIIDLGANEVSSAIGIISGLLEVLRGLWNGDWNKAVQGANTMVDGIKSAFQGLVDFLKNNVSWESILSESTGLKRMLLEPLALISGDDSYSDASSKMGAIKSRVKAELGLGLFESVTKDNIKDLSLPTLVGLKEWIDSGGSVSAFQGVGLGSWSKDITNEDILKAYDQMFSNSAAKRALGFDFYTLNSMMPVENEYTKPITTPTASGGEMAQPFAALGRYIWGIDDGIIQPGGGITRVNPNDWVFAVKNVADLAAAFMPSGNTYSGGNQIVNVNQTVNVSGGNLSPATVSSAAKQGMNQALNEMLSRSVNRYQMMSGMR